MNSTESSATVSTVMLAETELVSGFGSCELHRYPLQQKETLRAWDAADEFILSTVTEGDKLNAEQPDTNTSLLIVNDNFGALSVAFQAFSPTVITDSYISSCAIETNLQLNGFEQDAVNIVDSLFFTDTDIDDVEKENQIFDVVLIKIPKSLAMLEDQLHQIRSVIHSKTVIIAGAMSKGIHTSTLKLFETILGETKTSKAKKKARLIFSQLDAVSVTGKSPFPCSYKLPYQLDGEDISVLNHAAVFSTQKLDIGTRFLLENLPSDNRYKKIVDLGCGNGAVGLLAAIKNPQAELLFTDESYMAVASAMHNFISVFSETREAEFLQTDCLQGVEESSVSLVLCNPPFHQNNVINDSIAWQMFSETKTILEDAGELWVIGNRHLAYHAKLKMLFGNCEVVASNNKFTLLKAIKNKKSD